MEINKIYQGDSLEVLKTFPDKSINCCVTSPPYYGLRDYGVEGQLGLEKTPELYVENMVKVFREVKRVLRDDGTLWLNLGDSYCSTAGGTMGDSLKQTGILSGVSDERSEASRKFRPKVPEGLKPKDLIGVPWMVAFALRADGWYLRQDIIWSKPNPMPESVTDRCTKSHEYIFLLSKSRKYYYDAESILEDISDNTHARISQDVAKQVGSYRANGGAKVNGPMKAVIRTPKQQKEGSGIKNNDSFNNATCLTVDKRNKRSVWEVSTMPYSEAHFATFPPNLIVDCIKAGCPENGTVIDPFMGAGTTAMVSRKLNRNYVGIELNPKYIKIAEKRLYEELGMFK